MTSDSRLLTTPAAVRAAIPANAAGLVPTMGALHTGHRALIERSVAENPLTIVSIFVNPTQFTNPSDLAHYPRTLDRDLEIAFTAGADYIYLPAVETIYPPGFQTSVDPGPLASRWEGEFRPGHFRGVATVVSILLNTVRPARAYFGEKDFQQLAIVRRMTRDLNLPGEIVPVPTIREPDGLAMSSRNVRLTATERAIAAAVPDVLVDMRAHAAAGELVAAVLIDEGIARLSTVPEIGIDYLEIVDPETLEPLDQLEPGARALVAVRLGAIRIIDNLELLPAAVKA